MGKESVARRPVNLDEWESIRVSLSVLPRLRQQQPGDTLRGARFKETELDALLDSLHRKFFSDTNRSAESIRNILCVYIAVCNRGIVSRDDGERQESTRLEVALMLGALRPKGSGTPA